MSAKIFYWIIFGSGFTNNNNKLKQYFTSYNNDNSSWAWNKYIKFEEDIHGKTRNKKNQVNYYNDEFICDFLNVTTSIEFADYWRSLNIV